MGGCKEGHQRQAGRDRCTLSGAGTLALAEGWEQLQSWRAAHSQMLEHDGCGCGGAVWGPSGSCVDSRTARQSLA